MTFCSWGGALSDLEKQVFVDPIRQVQGYGDHFGVADQLREAEGDGRSEGARMGRRRRRRTVHLRGRRIPRVARHVADPERQGARRRLGHAQGHLHIFGRNCDRVEHEGLPGRQGPVVLEGFLGREGVSRTARPLQGVLLQLRGRIARGRHEAVGHLSGDRREGEARLRQAQRD